MSVAIHSRSVDSRYTLRSITAYLMLRAGLPPQDAIAGEIADTYRDMSFAEALAGMACKLDGRYVGDDNYAATVRTALSGGTLAAALDAAIGAAVVEGFRGVEDTAAGWVSEVGVGNYQENERYRLSGADNFELVPRGGQAGHAELGVDLETYKVARFGKQFAVDEQDFLDDYLGVIRRIPRALGEAAQRLRLDLIYSVLLANAAMQSDELPLFDVLHGNVSTGAALADSTLAAAVASLEKMTAAGVVLGIKAGYLVVPPTLGHTAAKLAQAIETDKANTSLAVRSEARLELGVTDPVSGETHAGSASTWYLGVRNGWRGIEVGYLGNRRSPIVRRFELDEGQWGVGWDVSWSLGAKAVDWHDLHRATA